MGGLRNVSEHMSALQDVARERFENARPHVSTEFASFKQQVANDFKSTSNDMKDAFGPGNSQALGTAIVGTAAGVVAAARLAPIRATRLAAHSVAAVAGKEAPC